MRLPSLCLQLGVYLWLLRLLLVHRQPAVNLL